MENEDRPRPPALAPATALTVPGPSSSGQAWPSSSDNLVEQSPATRSHAPSDCPSDVFSWHDDASSLAAFSGAADGIMLTVNTQRLRMGEHLKAKLEGMLRSRFENYLQIVHVMQNDTGKLIALECDLGGPFSGGEQAASRISISCNEDGTFFVYMAPEAAVRSATAASMTMTSSSSQDWPLASPYSGAGDSLLGAAAGSDEQDWQLDSSSPPSLGGESPPRAPATEGEEQQITGPVELLRKWTDQVCQFGMSGRCYSLTALFHFGYTTWSASKKKGTGERITEEDERLKEDFREPDECPQGPLASGSCSSAPAAVTASSSPPSPGAEEAKTERVGRSVAMLLMAAQQALDDAQHRAALDYCDEAMAVLGGETVAEAPAAAAASGGGDSLSDGETSQAMPRILLLRASIHTTLHNFDPALQDAEKLISLQPTCAEGYYWQSVALQGMHRCQEALEALMSALEYDPQNSLFQHAFTALFEDISASSPPPVAEASFPAASSSSLPAASSSAAPTVLHGRRSRGGQLGDALSQTTQATHLSSRSTTPTEVSAPQSRSSSQDSVPFSGQRFGEATEDQLELQRALAASAAEHEQRGGLYE